MFKIKNYKRDIRLVELEERIEGVIGILVDGYLVGAFYPKNADKPDRLSLSIDLSYLKDQYRTFEV